MVLAQYMLSGARVTDFSVYIHIQQGSKQAVNHLSGIRAQHGVWAEISEKLRFKNLTVNNCQVDLPLIGVNVIIGLGVLTKKSRGFELMETKKKNLLAVLLARMISSI